MVVPVAPLYNEYAQEVVELCKKHGFCVEADNDNGNTMNKKVRNAQLAQFNFIFGKSSHEYSLLAFLLSSLFPVSFTLLIPKLNFRLIPIPRQWSARRR